MIERVNLNFRRFGYQPGRFCFEINHYVLAGFKITPAS